MARDFPKSTGNELKTAIGGIGSLLNGAAFASVHCWAWADTLSTVDVNDNALVQVFINELSTGFRLSVNATGTAVLRTGARSVGADGYQAKNATSTFTTGAWHGCGAAYDYAGNIVTPYFNGVAEGGGAVTFANATYTHGTPTQNDAIGSVPGAHFSTWFDGRIAEVCIWYGARALTASEFAALGKCVSPELIGAGLGRIYWPLQESGSVRSKLGNVLATLTGTINKAPHLRTVYASRPHVFIPAAAPPSGFQAAWAHRSNTVIMAGVG